MDAIFKYKWLFSHGLIDPAFCLSFLIIVILRLSRKQQLAASARSNDSDEAYLSSRPCGSKLRTGLSVLESLIQQ